MAIEYGRLATIRVGAGGVIEIVPHAPAVTATRSEATTRARRGGTERIAREAITGWWTAPVGAVRRTTRMMPTWKRILSCSARRPPAGDPLGDRVAGRVHDDLLALSHRQRGTDQRRPASRRFLNFART